MLNMQQQNQISVNKISWSPGCVQCFSSPKMVTHLKWKKPDILMELYLNAIYFQQQSISLDREDITNFKGVIS